MLRPVLAAVALALCGADCRDGTCQTLQSYFKCEFDGRGGGGSGNTVAAARCEGGLQIVVRASFQLASLNSSQPVVLNSGFPRFSADEEIFFFERQEALQALQAAQHSGHFNTHEAEFVAQAVWNGLINDARPYRRWIPRREIELENRWREQAVGQAQHAFAIASPAAACDFCLRVHLGVYAYDSNAERLDPLKVDNPCTVHVSVMRKVMPLDLATLSLRELLVFLLGYVQDLSTFADLNLWHDCHLGNLLMQRQPGSDDHTFHWHDLGGVASQTRPAKAVALEEFVKKMRTSINKTAEMILTREERVSIPEPVFEPTDAKALRRDLQEYTRSLRIEVMRSGANERIRWAVLHKLTSTVSAEVRAELERELIQSAWAQALSQLWIEWLCIFILERYCRCGQSCLGQTAPEGLRDFAAELQVEVCSVPAASCSAYCVALLAQDGDIFNEIGAAFQVKGDLKNALSSAFR